MTKKQSKLLKQARLWNLRKEKNKYLDSSARIKLALKKISRTIDHLQSDPNTFLSHAELAYALATFIREHMHDSLNLQLGNPRKH